LEQVIQEEELSPIVIDLGANRRGELTEQTLMQMGGQIKWMISQMFAGTPINAMFRGTKREINSFGSALYREKKYMNSYLRYGLNDSRTYRDKARLANSVKGFESATGLTWPFK
tara:strand:+ start:1178 stop:1519 length:342 start_codon:yes stop_codon:yes gene_type:complete